MDIFLPTLEAKMTALVGAFRFLVFAIMVAGLITYMAGSRAQGMEVITPILKAIVIVSLIAYMDQWFPKVESAFMDVANYIDAGYAANPTSSSDAIRESTTTNPEGQAWSWRHLNESIYQAVTRALANIFIYIGTLITVPMLILQYVLRWLLYLLTPFALAIFMVPGLAPLGVRFFQQLLAIMAWPVGFAITNLVAMAVWTDFRSAVGANPQNVTDAVVYSPLLTFMGGILATIVIVVGMISTPVVMQMLFSQGHAFTGASANPASIVRGGARSIYGMSDRLFRSRSALRAPPAATDRPSAPPPSPIGAETRPGI
ncbi:MAG: hypothetical protein KGJ37_06425 [Verrucomicrobiota bacterium]|nr:hypothetical protein [Verrucomicrobiota bacterium]